MTPERSRGQARAWLRWVPGVALAASLALSWGLFLSGGMRAVLGWTLLIALGQTLGPLALLAVAFHALRRRRFSAPMQLAMGLSLVSLWPAMWSFGLGRIRFPGSLQDTGPAVSVRLPSASALRVAWGGDRLAGNDHAFTPDQRWAYDLLIEPALHGAPALEAYGCYGTPVVAPVAARVHWAVDGEPDEVPGRVSGNARAPLGNAVVLSLETGSYLVIAHLRPGSVRVRAGEEVAEGQPLGECGNSGNTSEPHIHIHHQRQDPRGRPINFSEGLPLYFRDHGGPAMPEGGIEVRDGVPVAVGAIVEHEASSRGPDASRGEALAAPAGGEPG